MINYIWGFLIIIGIIIGICTGNIDKVSSSIIESAKQSAQLCLSLIGVYALWLGLLNIADKAGIVNFLASKLRRVLSFLFREVRAASQAMGYISLNIVANMLGMGNAATPFGLKAMQEMQKDNPHKDLATDSMCMFLIVNASSVQLLPLTIIALRGVAGSAAPSEIVLPALIVTGITTLTGIMGGLICRKKRR